ncbi:MAG: TonB C-terminal domain-containing protein [Myxococcota bacterium]
MRPEDITVGLALTLAVHAVIVAILLFAGTERREALRAVPATGSFGYGLCGERRCALPEDMRPRREPAPDPVGEVEVLEAALMPALGSQQPDPGELPELQTYEQPEVVEDAVNLEESKKPEEVVKEGRKPREAHRDPKSEEDLQDILKDFEEDDPRKRATRLDEIIGHEEGEVGGQGAEARAGNIYAAKVSRAVRKVFTVPPFLDEGELKNLRVRVRVTRMSHDGEIVSYRVVEDSDSRAFNDAAVDAVRRFVPSEGGSKELPAPDPDVLRWINTKGMRIDLDGRYMSR